MFVNGQAIDKESGRAVWRTIDRERGLELREIKISYDEAFFALEVEGRDLFIGASRRNTGENKSVIEYTIGIIGGSFPGIPPYRFSSPEEKLRIAKYVEEALKAYGLHYSLPAERSVEVKFTDPMLAFSGDAQ